MSPIASYTAFIPQIFLEARLRTLETEHFALSNGFQPENIRPDGTSPRLPELEAEILRVRGVLREHT